MRPIDGDAVRAAIKDVECGEKYGCKDCPKTTCRVCFLLLVVDLQPTLDVQPVRQGHWIKNINPAYSPFDGSPSEFYVCSKCGEAASKPFPYCHCGAKMEEEQNV